MKRTPQNCTIADKMYDRSDKERYSDGKCSGVFDENGALNECRECKYFYWYE